MAIYGRKERRPVYVVVNWSAHFESTESRRTINARWLAMPNKHDGKSFRRLMREPDAAALYGAWSVLLQVASKCPARGILADLDGPMTAEDLEDKTGIPARDFERMLHVVSSDRIGWLEVIEDADEHQKLMADVEKAARGRSRRSPADSDSRPQLPADSAVHPQTPADLDDSPQSAGKSDSILPSRARAGGQTDRQDRQTDNPPIVPQGGHAISDLDPELPPSPNGHSSEKKESGGAEAMLATWSLCCGIFGRKKGGLTHKVQFALAELMSAEVLPLTESEAETLTAFYAAARRDTESRALWHPRDTAETLAENLPAEMDKAWQWARETDFAGEKKKGPAEIDAQALRQWCEAMGYPATWRDVAELPRDVVREFRAAQQQPEGNAA